MHLAFQHLLENRPWLFAPLLNLKESTERFLQSRWPVLLLLVLGMLRAVLFLMAYAPADGADAGDYYNYAAYIHGIDLPSRVANVSPVYPYLIYFFYYILGNLNYLIFTQLALSSLLGVLVFIGLRSYNVYAAFLAALMVLGDAQIGILFNFTSTEPIYIFLLCLSYCLAVYKSKTQRPSYWQAGLLGLVLVLLRETRTVGNYLFIPILILFILNNRSWRHSLVAIASFLLAFNLFNIGLQVNQTSQVSSTNEIMYLRPLLQYGLLNPDAGAASAQLSESLLICQQDFPELSFVLCMETLEGNLNGIYSLARNALIETIFYDFSGFLGLYFSSFNDFLTQTGRQYYSTPSSPSPADVQCENIAERLERNIQALLDTDWKGLELSPSQLENYRETVRGYTGIFCPAWKMNETVRQIVDTIAISYNMLNLPRPILLHSFFFMLTGLIPWGRKFWYPILLAGVIWVYHAAVSAAVINVQARYIAVTNPFKAILLSIFFIVGLRLSLRVLDYLASRPK